MKRFIPLIAVLLILLLLISLPTLRNTKNRARVVAKQYEYSVTDQKEIVKFYQRNSKSFKRDAMDRLSAEMDKTEYVQYITRTDDYVFFCFGLKGFAFFKTYYGVFCDLNGDLSDGSSPGAEWTASEDGLTFTKIGNSAYIENIGDGFYYFEGR